MDRVVGLLAIALTDKWKASYAASDNVGRANVVRVLRMDARMVEWGT